MRVRIEQSGEHVPIGKVYLPSSFGEFDEPTHFNDALALTYTDTVGMTILP